MNRFRVVPQRDRCHGRRRGDLRRHRGLPRRRTLVGPAARRLLAGPLDAAHWSEWAFVRMAYNSGKPPSSPWPRSSPSRSLRACSERRRPHCSVPRLVAVVPYVLAESALGVVLEALLGERPTAALRHHLPLNAIVVPWALLGAGAGLAAIDVGWWSAGLLLLRPLLPELLLVRVRRRVRLALVRVVGGLLALGVVLVALDARPSRLGGMGEDGRTARGGVLRRRRMPGWPCGRCHPRSGWWWSRPRCS